MAVAEGLVRCYALPLVVALYLIVALHGFAPGIRGSRLAAGIPLALASVPVGPGAGKASIDQSVPGYSSEAPWAPRCTSSSSPFPWRAHHPVVRAARGEAPALRALGEPAGPRRRDRTSDDPTGGGHKALRADYCRHGGLRPGHWRRGGTSHQRRREPRHRFPSPSCSSCCAAAALQLYGAVRSRWACAPCCPRGPIRKWGRSGAPYRLAILLMVGGFVAVPLLESVGVSGVAVVLAGYLGVFSVLVSLFLIMGASAVGTRRAPSPGGFAALFAGEISGVLIGGIVGAIPGTFDVSAALRSWPAWR